MISTRTDLAMEAFENAEGGALPKDALVECECIARRG